MGRGRNRDEKWWEKSDLLTSWPSWPLDPADLLTCLLACFRGGGLPGGRAAAESERFPVWGSLQRTPPARHTRSALPVSPIFVMLNCLIVLFCGIWVTQKANVHFMQLVWLINSFCINCVCFCKETHFLLSFLQSAGKWRQSRPWSMLGRFSPSGKDAYVHGEETG